MSEFPKYSPRSKFDAALDEFDPEHRVAILAFADNEKWWRRFLVHSSPALALQLAIDPALEHARAMLDEMDSEWTNDDVARAAGLEVPRHTRPAQLRVVGVKVQLASENKRRLKTKCSR